MINHFVSHGVEYVIDKYGVIHQLKPEPYKYDENYVHTYDTPDYQIQSDLLQALRLGFLIGSHGSQPLSIHDVGYGNGAFMKFARRLVNNVTGSDISGVEIPGFRTTRRIEAASVITFWDALEHIPNLDFVKSLPCETVIISLPWCHFHSMGKNWFDFKYPHRKPNEHLHHFDSYSLKNFMSDQGWHEVSTCNHEDIVRKSKHEMMNILSMSFKRK